MTTILYVELLTMHYLKKKCVSEQIWVGHTFEIEPTDQKR